MSGFLSQVRQKIGRDRIGAAFTGWAAHVPLVRGLATNITFEILGNPQPDRVEVMLFNAGRYHRRISRSAGWRWLGDHVNFQSMFRRIKYLLTRKATPEQWGEAKSAALEAVLGKQHDTVIHSIIPYALGGD